MAYSKAKLKSSGDKASPCHTTIWIEKLSDKCLSTQILPCTSFKPVLISLNSFLGAPNTVTGFLAVYG
jgi:hypothetical protein